jgi:hypothetical protein
VRLTRVLSSAIVIVIVVFADAKQLLSFVPNIAQRQARRPRTAFAFLRFILWEYRRSWCVGFIVQREQLRAAHLVVCVGVEVEGGIGSRKWAVQSRDLASSTIVPLEMIGNVEANSGSQKIGDDVPELEGLIGKQGLHDFAHNAAEDKAYEDREEHWTMAPEPYPPVFPSENVTVQGAGNIKKYQLTPRHQR